MSPPKVGFNSYVDIATSMDNRHHLILKPKQHPAEGDEDFDASKHEVLKLEWTRRVQDWQKQFPDRGLPIEDCRTTEEFEFQPFFLQHPIAAMSFWNVMQAFYALDRLVCGTSASLLKKVSLWEKMQPFQYFKASNIKQQWQSSLEDLGKEIHRVGLENPANPQPRSKFHGKGQKAIPRLAIPDTESEREKREAETLSRFDGIFLGIAKWKESRSELRRSLQQNLRSIKLINLMLEKIDQSASRRFLMVNSYLKSEGKQDSKRHSGTKCEVPVPSGTLSTAKCHVLQVADLLGAKVDHSQIKNFESRTYSPPKRRNSIKHRGMYLKSVFLPVANIS